MYSPTETCNKFDENHNHAYDNENITEPVMKISSFKNLRTVGVINVPSYEEKVASIELSDEFSLDSQRDHSTIESSLENTGMRDISKKYLNSLVKNKQPYVLNNYSTPPVSIRENSPIQSENTSVTFKSNLEKNNLKSQSCSNLSADIEEKSSCFDNEYPSLKEKKIVSQFMKSVPNIQEYEDMLIKNRLVDILEAEGIVKKPSVKNLMKIFDKKEENVSNNFIFIISFRQNSIVIVVFVQPPAK